VFRYFRKIFGDRALIFKVIGVVFPIIIQGTVTNVVSLLDNLMVGNVGTLPMAAVAIVNQLLFIYYLCIWGGFAGPSIFATQYAGAHNHLGVRYCFRYKGYLGALVTLGALIVLLAFDDELIGLYLLRDNSQENLATTLSLAKSYLRVMVWGLPPFVLAQMVASTLKELGETKVPMFSSLIAIVVNLVLNYVLIFGHCGFAPMGVVGAAIATVLSRIAEMGFMLLHIHFCKNRYPFLKVKIQRFVIPLRLIGCILKRGLMLLINEIFWSSAIALQLQGFSLRGLDVVAACTITFTVANVFNCCFFSMGDAITILVGHELGAGRMEQADDLSWKLTWQSCAMALVMAVLVSFLAPFIPLLYKTEEHVRDLSVVLLWIVASHWPARVFFHCNFFVIRAGGRTMLTSLLDGGFNWCVTLPVLWYIGYKTSMDIRPFFFIVHWMCIFQCVLGYLVVKSGCWKRRIIE